MARNQTETFRSPEFDNLEALWLEYHVALGAKWGGKNISNLRPKVAWAKEKSVDRTLGQALRSNFETLRENNRNGEMRVEAPDEDLSQLTLWAEVDLPPVLDAALRPLDVALMAGAGGITSFFTEKQPVQPPRLSQSLWIVLGVLFGPHIKLSWRRFTGWLKREFRAWIFGLCIGIHPRGPRAGDELAEQICVWLSHQYEAWKAGSSFGKRAQRLREAGTLETFEDQPIPK